MVGMSVLERLFWSFMVVWPLWIFIIIFALVGILEYFRPDLFDCDDEDEDDYDDEDDY